MSDELYPGDLPGLRWDIGRRPRFKTSIYEAMSGAERRIRQRVYPKYDIELQYEFLRATSLLPELDTLLGFYLQRGGSFDSFLFLDPSDCIAANLSLGVGDGVATTFQMMRRRGGYSEPVHNVGADFTPYRVFFPPGDMADFWPEHLGWPVDGEIIPAPGTWTLLPGGRVQFATPPAAGALLVWSGSFYFRARFADDQFDYSEFYRRLYTAKKVNLVASLQNIL